MKNMNLKDASTYAIIFLLPGGSIWLPLFLLAKKMKFLKFNAY